MTFVSFSFFFFFSKKQEEVVKWVASKKKEKGEREYKGKEEVKSVSLLRVKSHIMAIILHS